LTLDIAIGFKKSYIGQSLSWISSQTVTVLKRTFKYHMMVL